MSTTAEFPALGFDPAPGNPGNVDGLVTRLNTAAAALDSAHGTLSSLTRGGGAWQGAAATAFSGKVGELPGLLQDSSDAVHTAARQLDGWRQLLISYQDTARRYESEAQAAKQRRQGCEQDRSRAENRYNAAADDPAFSLAGRYFTDDAQLTDAKDRLDAAQRELDRAAAELDQAKRALDDAEDAFDAVVKQAKDLHGDHQDAAEKVAAALRRANQNAPETSAWDSFKDALKRAGHAIKEWATKHAELLKKIGDWLSLASGVLGIAALCTAWCPPLSGALALAGGVASAGALAAHGMAKLGGANVSAMDLIGDGIGVLPFGKFGAVALKGTARATVAIRGGVAGIDEMAKVNRLRGLAGTAARMEDLGSGGKLFTAERGIGNRMKLAFEYSVADNAEALIGPGRLSDALGRTPGLRSIPGFAAAFRADGTLNPMSWWSRGPQIAGGAYGAFDTGSKLLGGGE